MSELLDQLASSPASPTPLPVVSPSSAEAITRAAQDSRTLDNTASTADLAFRDAADAALTSSQNQWVTANGTTTSNLSQKATEAYNKATSTFGAVAIGGADFVKLATAGTPFATLGSSLAAFTNKKFGAVDAAAAMKVSSEFNSISQNPITAATAKSIEPKSVGVKTDHLVSLTELGESEIGPADYKYKVATVFFEVMPEISESRTVSYDPIAPAQFPGAFQKYKGTDSVQWTIQATFVARNSYEASMNLRYIRTLRGWTQTFFGEELLKLPSPTIDGATQKHPFSGKLGAPPPTLMFKGYSRSLIGPVPVVITSLTWQWPKDVDYLPALGADSFSPSMSPTQVQNTLGIAESDSVVPFPAVLNVSIQLVESFSTTQFNNFNLVEFRKGNMVAAFNKGGSQSKNQTSKNLTPNASGATLTVSGVDAALEEASAVALSTNPYVIEAQTSADNASEMARLAAKTSSSIQLGPLPKLFGN